MPDYTRVSHWGVNRGSKGGHVWFQRTAATDVVVHCSVYGKSCGWITINGYTFEIDNSDDDGQWNHAYREFYIAKGTTYSVNNLSACWEIPLKQK